MQATSTANYVRIDVYSQKSQTIVLGNQSYELNEGENEIFYRFEKSDDLSGMQIEFVLNHNKNILRLSNFDVFYEGDHLLVSMHTLYKITNENYFVSKQIVNGKLQLEINKFWNSTGKLKFIVNPLNINSISLHHHQIVFFGNSSVNNFVSLYTSDTLMKYDTQQLWKSGSSLKFDYYTLSDNTAFNVFLGDRKFKFLLDSVMIISDNKTKVIPPNEVTNNLKLNHYLRINNTKNQYWIESLTLKGRQEPYISYNELTNTDSIKDPYKYIVEIQGSCVKENGLLSFTLIDSGDKISKIVKTGELINIVSNLQSATIPSGFELRISEPISNWKIDFIKIKGGDQDFMITDKILNNFKLSNSHEYVFHFTSPNFLQNKLNLILLIIIITFLLIFTNKLYFEYYK